MEYLLFTGYLIFFCWLVTKTKFFLNAGFTKSQLIILFLLKVIAGIFYGWVGIYYAGTAQMVDTWNYHYQSIDEYNLLGTNPTEYFTNLFQNNYEKGYLDFFGSKDSYWNDLKANFFTKLLSVFNIFSFGYYYVNVIFYNFLAFFGPIAFYRIMRDLYPQRKLTVLIGSFFIPSFFYWSSGLHKEGLLFMSIGLIAYVIYFGHKRKNYNYKSYLLLFISFLFLFILRSFVFAILIPAVIAWLLANRVKWKPAYVFGGIYGTFLLLFFTTRYIHPELDFPTAVVKKQQAFIQNVGKTTIPADNLEPTVLSFIKSIPQAVSFSSLRPYPSDIIHLLSLVAAAEILLIIFLLLVFIFFKRPEPFFSSAAIYFFVFFSVSMLLAIGFSVNNLGAICRYRSIIFPLILTPVIVNIDWNRFFQLFTKPDKNYTNGT